MLFILKPDPLKIKKVLERASTSAYTYSEVGSTACDDTVPKGYSENSYHKFLGMGKDIFEAGKKAVSRCEMYQIKFVELYLFNKTIGPQQGMTMAVVSRHFGLWSINPVRIVYKGEHNINGDTLFSFAVGTLAGHEEKGEERFSIRLSQGNMVYYEIFSFTTPAGILLKLAYPLEKMVLRSFAHNSAAAIMRFCKKC
jgi:uncharacterized protein (UPF0548 family)